MSPRSRSIEGSRATEVAFGDPVNAGGVKLQAAWALDRNHAVTVLSFPFASRACSRFSVKVIEVPMMPRFRGAAGRECLGGGLYQWLRTREGAGRRTAAR